MKTAILHFTLSHGWGILLVLAFRTRWNDKPDRGANRTSRPTKGGGVHLIAKRNDIFYENRPNEDVNLICRNHRIYGTDGRWRPAVRDRRRREKSNPGRKPAE
jgi:hypothetical protein